MFRNLLAMPYKWIIFVVLLLNAAGSQAQKTLRGVYDEEYHTFNASDRRIITQPFASGLGAFMIKGADPNNGETNRVGFIDTTGKIVIRPIYTNCSPFRGNLALVKDTLGNTAVINHKGNIVIPFGPYFITRCSNGLFIKTRNGQARGISIVDAKNHTILPFGKYALYASRWASIYPLVMEDGYYSGEPAIFQWDPLPFYVLPFDKYLPVKTEIGRTDKWAILNSRGKEVVPPKYDGIGLFVNGVAPFRSDKKCGILDTAGNEIIPPEYDNIELSGNYFVIAIKNRKSGILTPGGKVLAPFVYRRITNIGQDRLLVDSATGTYAGKSAVIGKNGAFIIPLANNDIQPFGNGYLITKNNDSTAVFDSTGIRKSDYARRSYLNDGVWEMGDEKGFIIYNKKKRDFVHYDFIQDLIYQQDEKFGLLDSAGDEVTKAVYDEMSYLNNYPPIIKVRRGDLWDLLDNEGRELTPGPYDAIKYEEAGFLKVTKKGKYGLISERAKVIVPAKYDEVRLDEMNGSISGESIAVRLKGKWGYYGYNGKQLTPVKYDAAGAMGLGYAMVTIADKQGLVNSNGIEVVPCKYDKVIYGYGALWIVSKGGLFGLINHSGKVILPLTCSNVTFDSYNTLNVYYLTRDGKMGMADTTGKQFLPFKFSHAEPFVRYSNEVAKVLLVKDNGLCGIADFTGKILVPELYDQIFTVSGLKKPLYLVFSKQSEGIADEAGNVLIAVKNWRLGDVNDNGVIVNQDGYAGVLNWQQKAIVPIKYQQVSLAGKCFIVRTGDKHGAFDLQGKEIIPMEYDYISWYMQSVLFVTKNRRMGVIDETGKIILPVEYDEVTNCGREKILIKKDKLMGLIDYTGKVIYPCKYTFINCVNDKVVEIY